MKHRVGIVGAALSILAAMTVAAAPSGAHKHDPSPGQGEPLTPRSVFTDDIAVQITMNVEGRDTTVVEVADASHLKAQTVRVEPGVVFPWHTHPGPVMVSVVEGEFTYVYADDCVERVYPAGTAFVDPGDNVHSAYNSSDGVTVLVSIYLGVPAEGPLGITDGVEEPQDCEIG